MAIIKCPDCEVEISDRVHSCPHCDRFIGGGLPPTKKQADDTALSMVVPINVSAWALIAGYLGLFALVAFPAPFAIFAGIMAVRDLKRNPTKHGMGRAVFGIIMGSLGSIALVIILISMAVK